MSLMSIKRSSVRILLFIVLLLIVFSFIMDNSAFAAKKGVGMVLETGGPANIVKGSSKKKVRMMQPVFADTRIVTGSKGYVVFVSYLDNAEYRVEPASDVTVGASGFKANAGSIKKKTGKGNIPLPKNTTLVSRRIMGQVHRDTETGMKVINPSPNMVLASDEIKFQWTYGATHYYKLCIVEKGSEEIMEPFPVTVNGNSYEFKNVSGKKFKLEPGKVYTFKVKEKEDEDELEDEDTWNAQVDFSLLPADKAKKVLTARAAYGKSPKGSMKDTLLMVDLYKENGMFYQAIELLKKLETADNGNPYIYYYMAEMYDKLGDKENAKNMMKKGMELDKNS